MTTLERRQARRALLQQTDIETVAKAVNYAPSTLKNAFSPGHASYRLANRLARHLKCPIDLFL